MQFWNEQTPSFNLVYSSICYPAGMGTSKIRLLFATLLQHNIKNMENWNVAPQELKNFCPYITSLASKPNALNDITLFYGITT